MTQKHAAWAGMMSNASPYALPPGAAVSQVNLTTSVPGQLTTRGGMLPIRFATRPYQLVDIYPYEKNGRTFIIGLTVEGYLVSMHSPAEGEDAVPIEPDLSVVGGEVRTSYTYRYVDGTYGDVEDFPPGPPPGSPLISTLDGSATPAYLVDAETKCGDDDVSSFDGGRAATSRVPPTVPPSGLCEL